MSLSSYEADLAVAPPAAAAKPLLRGVSHQIGFFVALVASVGLVARCTTRDGMVASAVFGAALVLQLGASALYHRVDWAPAARQQMRRLDHAAIFLLIAGGYTPLLALTAHPEGGHRALLAIWALAGIGVVKSIAWPHAPKWLTALACVAIGWVVVGDVVARTPVVGATSIALLVSSGVTYSLGAVVYAVKRPDPWPRVFGYHEIFHLFVVAASVLLFAHVVLVLRATSA